MVVLSPFGAGKRHLPIYALVSALLLFYLWASTSALDGYVGASGHRRPAAQPPPETFLIT
ncbi:MAG: hypothetical protein M1837_001395, partial [Sclerophora amabilis]